MNWGLDSGGGLVSCREFGYYLLLIYGCRVYDYLFMKIQVGRLEFYRPSNAKLLYFSILVLGWSLNVNKLLTIMWVLCEEL